MWCLTFLGKRTSCCQISHYKDHRTSSMTKYTDISLLESREPSYEKNHYKHAFGYWLLWTKTLNCIHGQRRYVSTLERKSCNMEMKSFEVNNPSRWKKYSFLSWLWPNVQQNTPDRGNFKVWLLILTIRHQWNRT